MPQQAVANGSGHSELRRAQFTTFFSCVVRTLSGRVCVSIRIASSADHSRVGSFSICNLRFAIEFEIGNRQSQIGNLISPTETHPCPTHTSKPAEGSQRKSPSPPAACRQ